MVLNARGRPHIDAVDKAMKVQFADVGIAGKPYETDVLAAAIRVLKSGNYIGGSEVEALEREFVEFCGAAEAVSVRTGTDALTFALRAAGVGLGDEVITVPLTAGAGPATSAISPPSASVRPRTSEPAARAAW